MGGSGLMKKGPLRGRIFEFSDGWNEAWERGEVNL